MIANVENQNAVFHSVARDINEECNLLYCNETREIFKYIDGVYKTIDIGDLKRIVKHKLNGKYNIHSYNEVKHHFETDSGRSQSELNQSDLINLKNGMFDLNTFELKIHSPHYLCTNQLAVNYNPEAKCPLWIKTLKEIFQNDEGSINNVQEFFGLCFTKETKYEKALFLKGEGANGKSVIIHILRKMLGNSNKSSIPLECFNKSEYLSALVGKLVNITTETNAKSSVYDATFKSIVSGEDIRVKNLYADTYDYTPYCKLVFALNNLPRVDDKTDGFWRRVLIIELKRQFGEHEQNKNLKYELEQELDGIFLWCIQGLQRLRERGYFQETDEMLAKKNEFRLDNNNVLAFVDDVCTLDDRAEVTKQSLYSDYSKWCQINGYYALSKKKFGMELVKNYLQIKDLHDRSTRKWGGISVTTLIV